MIRSAAPAQPAASQTSRTPHVVVVGGGFGGLAVVRALRRAKCAVDVTMIDKHTYNTFQPLLYQVATATLNPGDVTWFLRAVRQYNRRVRFVNAELTGIDRAAREVLLRGGETIGYDYVVIATGVTANFFGVPGAEQYALPLYTRADALALRDLIGAHLERAAAGWATTDTEMRVVVVGGGPTGVETAGALAEMRNHDMPVTYPELNLSNVHVSLVEMGPHLLAPFSPKSRDYTRRSLVERGVDLRLNTTVSEVRSDGVMVQADPDAPARFLAAQVVVWASGVKASDAVADWGLDQGRAGRIVVDDHLRAGGDGRVFAVGDIAVGEPALPQLAQVALQGGDYVGKHIAADVAGRTTAAFGYRDKGILATIGRKAAVAEASNLPRMQGLPAWVIWTVVHIYSLLGMRNRAAAMVNLGAKYLFWNRSHNAIVGESPVARQRPIRPD